MKEEELAEKGLYESSEGVSKIALLIKAPNAALAEAAFEDLKAWLLDAGGEDSYFEGLAADQAGFDATFTIHPSSGRLLMKVTEFSDEE